MAAAGCHRIADGPAGRHDRGDESSSNGLLQGREVGMDWTLFGSGAAARQAEMADIVDPEIDDAADFGRIGHDMHGLQIGRSPDKLARAPAWLLDQYRQDTP